MFIQIQEPLMLPGLEFYRCDPEEKWKEKKKSTRPIKSAQFKVVSLQQLKCVIKCLFVELYNQGLRE